MSVIDVEARNVREGDVLVARSGDMTWLVIMHEKRGDGVTMQALEGDVWRLEAGYLCRVLDRRECDGSCVEGAYIAGAVVNGKLPVRGKCFRCGGKGYQTRADALRNHYYDNRVRRA